MGQQSVGMLSVLRTALLSLMMDAIGRLPFGAIRVLSGLLASVFFPLPIRWNRVMKENWCLAFDRKPSGKDSFLVWWHFFHNTLCALKVAKLSGEDYAQRVELKAGFNYTNLQKTGRPSIVVTAHLGCWEVLPRLPLIIGPGKYAALFQSLHDEFLNKKIQKLRQRDGVVLIERKNAWKGSLAALRQGYSLAVLADQNSGRHGIWCDFFGRLASTSGLPSLLSIRAKAPLIPLLVRTLPGSRWVVEAQAPIEPGEFSVEQQTAHLNKMIEQRIRDYPWDWLWFHERWKLPNPQWLLGRWAHRIHAPEPEKLKKLRVVVRSMNWLGDAVMHLRALRDMKLSRPDLYLAVACPTGLTKLYERCDFLDEVLPIPAKKSLLKTSAILRQGRFDVAVLMPNSFRVVLEATFAGIPHRAGYRVRGRTAREITIKVPLEKIAQGKEHQSLTWTRAVHYWGGVSRTEPILLKRSHTAPRNFSYGVIAPGAAYGPAKMWPAERFAEAGKLLQETILHWIVVGAATDAEACARVQELLPGSENLAGKTSLGELIDLLAYAQVVLSNDSGVMHLAAATGAPTVGIFGSTSPDATRPVDPAQIVYKKIECSPCFQRTCRFGHYNCLTQITAWEVAEAALRAVGQLDTATTPARSNSTPCHDQNTTQS